MIELTAEQRLALAAENPLRVLDPQTQELFVLLRWDVYERIKLLLDDADPKTMYPHLAELSPDDWEGPAAYGITPHDV